MQSAFVLKISPNVVKSPNHQLQTRNSSTTARSHHQFSAASSDFF